MPNVSQQQHGTLVGIVLLAVAYAGCGYLALLLSIPPGYAAAVYPPAGFALAALLIWGYRFVPGVWLGCFVLDAWVTYRAAGPDVASFWIPALIASGAALQAVIGAKLIRGYAGARAVLVDDRTILRVLVLGGPIACVISPTVGVGTLWWTDIIQYEEVAFSWWTWWIGDVLGVLLFTPVAFTLFAKPRPLWRRRVATVALPLLLMLAAVVAVFVQAGRWEESRIRDEFDKLVTNLAHRLEAQLASYEQILLGLERFYAASVYVSREEFHLFVDGYLHSNAGIQAIEWLPRVSHTERARFEASVRGEGLPEFVIRENSPDGQLVPAAKRAVYFPVVYLDPVEGNETVLGFDVLGDPVRGAALERAMDTGRSAASAAVTLMQGGETQKGILVFQPVYGRNSPQSPATGKVSIEGMVVLVLKLPDILETIYPAAHESDYALAVLDVTDSTRGELLYETAPSYDFLRSSVPVQMAGRRLELIVTAAPHYVAANRGWQAWTILAAGLFATSLLGALLLSVTGRAEATRLLVERRTRELREILDNALDTIITIDANGVIQSANPAAERLFGYSVSEMVGSNVKLLMPSPLRDEHDGYIAQYLESGLAKIIGRRRETIGQRKDGSTVPIEVGVSEVRSEDKVFFTAMVHDLTERRRVERLQREFISAVSHELRTPLTSIRGSLALLVGGAAGPLDGNVRDLVQRAASNAERLTLLINDILDIEKLESGYPKVNLQVADLRQLVRKAMDDAAGYAQHGDVRLTLRDNVQGPICGSVDPDRFQQVMANLLSNAIKYSPKASSVDVNVKRVSESVWIGVSDHGPGVPAEFRSQIFKKFARADTSDSRHLGGTGLGLSIAKTIVEKMGGSIGFETEEGLGSTFHFTVRAVEPQTSLDATATDV